MGGEALLARARKLMLRRKGITEKRMFGGHCFFANANMIGGVSGKGELMIRVGPDRYEEALEHPHARKMDFTGRPMKGFVIVDEAGYEADDDFKYWLDLGMKYARSLPSKEG